MAANPSFKQYLASSWHELGKFERAIMIIFLTLGCIFFIYMAFRLIYALVT